MTVNPIRLVPLTCCKCHAPVPAQPDEIAWVCEQCGQGLLLDAVPAPGPAECGTQPLQMFFSKALPQGQPGHPFWVARAQVSITRRDTYSGNESRAANEFWGQPRLFYIPAWEATLDDTLRLGVSLLKNPQRMEPGSPGPFLPVVTPPGDVRALAEFLLVSIEADRRDALKTIDFTMQLETPQLWVMP